MPFWYIEDGNYQFEVTIFLSPADISCLLKLVPFSVYLQTEIPVRAGRLLWAAEIRFPQFCVGDAFSALWLTHNFSCFQEKIGVLGRYFLS